MSVCWTQDRIARMIRLWARGRSAAQIARALGGVSRIAVIDKLRGLGRPPRRPAPRRAGRATRPGGAVANRSPRPLGASPGLVRRGKAAASCREPFRALEPRLEALATRVARWGAEGLSEAETLDWMLSRTTGARPNLPETLLARFGGLARVLGASAGELSALVGQAAATELILWRDVARRLLVYPLHQRDLLTSFGDVQAYLRLMLRGAATEQFRVLFLDHGNRLIADELMGQGTVDHAPVYPREVVRRALELTASALCLVHNHPSASSAPSRADIEMTRKVCEAARALGLTVHDHFLVAGDQVVSFRTRGLM